MSEQSLKEKTVKGVGWSAADNVLQYVVTFVVSIILARLLTPSDYGLIGIVTIFTAICNTVINGGFMSALVRKNDVTTDDYNTVLICNFLTSVVLYGILFILSPFIASFFERAELVPLIRVASLGLIIGSFSIVQKARLTKQIDFKTQTKVSFLASLISGIVGVVFAFLGFGVWSLVAQHLTSSFLSATLLWVFNKWSPSFLFSKKSFVELFGYSWKMLLSGLLDTIWNQLSQVVVGKFYHPDTLGHFTRAKQFAEIISLNFTNVIQRVSFPALSEVQEDKERLIGAYRRILKVSMLFSAVLLFGMGAVSEPMIHCLLGEKWHQAALYLPLVCIHMSTYPLHSLNLNLLQIQGRSDLFLYLEIIKKSIAVVPLVLGAMVGIYTMLIANIVVTIISFFLNSYYTGKLLGYTPWMQIKDVSSSYMVAIIMGAIVFFFKYLPISDLFILPLQLIVGFFVTVGLCNLFKLQEYFEIREIVVSYYHKIVRR